MKKRTKIIFSLIILFLSISISSVFAQIECVGCGGMNGNHSTSCKYYNPPRSSGSSSGGSSGSGQSMEQIIVGTMLEYLFTPTNNNNSETERIAEEKRKAEQEAARLEAQRIAAEQKRVNDSISKAKYDNMMKSYKTLDATHPMGMKPIEVSTVKFKPLDAEIETDAQKEQKKLETDTQTWVEYQKEQFKIRTEQPNYWCKHYYENLGKDKVNEEADYYPFKKLKELEAGDVLLFAPQETGWDGLTGAAVADVGNFGQATQESKISHTVTYLKEINGKKIFLDNMPGEGPKIITEDALRERYIGRDASVAKVQKTFGVAQPLNSEEAQRLWDKARELEVKNLQVKMTSGKHWWNDETNYGAFGKNDLVCSEASWTLLKAAGRDLPISKSWKSTVGGVDFSPADFYAYKQYFLITPLDIGQ